LSTNDPGAELRELARAVRFDCEDVCEFGLHVLDEFIARPHPTGLRDAADLFALAGRRVRALHDQLHGDDGTVPRSPSPGSRRGAD